MRRRLCTKAEFDAFVAAYPLPLVRRMVATGDPPSVQFCDDSLGDWPVNVVASYLDEWGKGQDGWSIADGAQ